MEATDTQGKAIDQNEILPMKHRAGGEEGIKNKHWDQETGKREGPLHYNEFMLRLSGRRVNEDNIPPRITAPSGADDLERAAQELVDNRLTNNLEVHQINDRFGQVGGGGKVNQGKGRKPAKARDDGRYQRLMSALSDQLVKWRNNEKSYAKIRGYDTIMKSLTDRIVQLRIEDGQRFMLTHFSEAKGLGLEGKLVKYKESPRVPGGPDYERVDLGKTWENHEEDVKKAISKVTDGKVQIKKFKHFEAWVTDYGNPDGRFAEATKANPSHFRTLQMWKAIGDGRTC